MLSFDLKKCREALHLTQQQVADLFKIPQSSISAIENGKQEITLAQIKLLESNYEFKLIDYLTEVEARSISFQNSRGKLLNESREGIDSKAHKEVVEMFQNANQSYMGSLDRHYTELQKANEKIQTLQDEARQFEKQLLELRLALATKGITL